MAAWTNAKQNIPDLFKIIMKADREKDAFLAQTVVPMHAAIKMIRARRDMTRAAEEKLSWNTNKGKR